MIDIFSILCVLVISFIVLIVSSHLVTDNAIKLAEFFKISMLAIGFILVSVSTSLPELAVSVTASSGGEGGISVGNVMGANILNILIILGICALMGKIVIKSDEMIEIVRVLFMISILPLILIILPSVGRLGGIVLLIIFFINVYLLQKKKIGLEKKEEHVITKNAVSAFIFFFIGIIGLIVSANFMINSAVKISDVLGLTTTVIGATIISIGTTLPELATSTTAMKKGHTSLAFGNVVGSCLTNLTLVLGSAALINPVPIEPTFTVLAVTLLISTLVLWYLIETKKELNRSEGIVFIFMYMIFVMTIFGVDIGLHRLT